MLINNRKAVRQLYPNTLQSILNVKATEQSRQWLMQWNLIENQATPLWSLPALAKKMDIGQLFVKDESYRSPLGSFKALGAPNALVQLIHRTYPDLKPEQLLQGQYADKLADFTVISATDGNHGRSLAAAAQSIGCRCVIVLHANVSIEREQGIAQYGAEIIRISGGYDESVDKAASLATENNWQVVSDTSYPGYEIVPRDVMQGYSVMVAEIIEQLENTDSTPFSHVFLQGGVGGLAAGVISYFCEYYGENRPTFIVVEPTQADCLYQSAIKGETAEATGDVDSVMAGLACGKTSYLAWQFLEPFVDYFMLVDDVDAEIAMKTVAIHNQTDIPFVGGESGVAGIAGIMQLSKQALLSQVGLDRTAKVLMINTEGATAPNIYQQIVGVDAETVLSTQKQWLAKQNS